MGRVAGGATVNTVLVPLDGTSHATAALPVARALAEIASASLRVLHVGEPMLATHDLPNALRLEPEDIHALVLEQVTGDAAERIVRLARDCQSVLIVMCTHTRQKKPRGAIGSVAARVLQDASCPVVLVRPQRGTHPWALRQIVLPHDGTPTSAAALGPAVSLAQLSGAEIIVLHVPTADLPDEPDSYTMPQYVDQPQHEWPMWAREFLERTLNLSEQSPEIRTRLFLRRGKPGDEVVRLATEQEADLIALAWHGSLEVGRAGIVKQVLKEAPCPIFTLRIEAPAEEAGEFEATDRNHFRGGSGDPGIDRDRAG